MTEFKESPFMVHEGYAGDKAYVTLHKIALMVFLYIIFVFIIIK